MLVQLLRFRYAYTAQNRDSVRDVLASLIVVSKAVVSCLPNFKSWGVAIDHQLRCPFFEKSAN
jgi:hypothetical protein